MSTSLVAYLNRVAANFTYYDNIIYLSLGIPCNIINMVVFARLLFNRTNKTNMGFLGLCQSILDTTLLLYFSLVYRSSAFFGYNFSNINDPICRITNFIRRFLTCTSSWMQLVTTFDRFVYIMFGHGGRFSFMRKKRYLALIIAVVFLFLAVASINNLLYYYTNGVCTADSAILVASDMVMICLRIYVPLSLMIIFNGFMLKTVIKKRKTVFKQSSMNRKEYLFTIAVMANDTVFFLLEFPLTVYFLFYDSNLFAGAFNNNALFTSIYGLIGSICKDLAFYQQTLPFFVYLTFNKLYRNELLNIVGKVVPIKRDASVVPSKQTNNTLNHTNHHHLETTAHKDEVHE